MMAIRELKVCLLGDTGVGKSSIVCRFVQDHFDHNISPTIGASFMTKTVPCGNELHKFLIWDTAGQERFHSLAPMYYRGSAAAVIVYDITKQDSFHTLKKWVKELKEHGPENIVMAIAGNKCDLSDIRHWNSPKRCSTSKDKGEAAMRRQEGRNHNKSKSHNCWMGDSQTGEHLYHRSPPTGVKVLSPTSGF
ncbi:ras-related protein Rab-31 isoform X5 [Phocoena sinus]|uniref:ras-related protein Rab-31 isoform X5 n=1 Tax=Phocoena sinus TaxID=42100 RepID=UPI0013C45F1F|nr:ras-related protein Rab-31 isoform X5 [Phocoena sinus]